MNTTGRSSLKDELAELRRWKPRPKVGEQKIFGQLVLHEFLDAGSQVALQARALGRIVQYAAAHVPYYREVFARQKLAADSIRGIEDLPRVPVLTKATLVNRAGDLRSRAPVSAEGSPITFKSTGTTGQPVEMVMSRGSARMFGLLWHRLARWFRYDPAGSFAKIRLPSTLPRLPDGSQLPLGKAICRNGWEYLGAYFETGPEIAFGLNNVIEWQVDRLRQFRPDYVLAAPGHLEELALACDQDCPVDSLKSLLGVASWATPSLRASIERMYALPFQQNYGLNEIGMVAIRCPAGRYHVNAEHCLVEIVDAHGQPARPGTCGHILVTGLQNVAMPLLRYDTGDMAYVTDGPCACGRTLPSFGEIAGRYRRFAGLPEGTRKRVDVLLGAFMNISPELIRNLRKYQIYQDLQNRFELRVQFAGPVPAEFVSYIRHCWQTQAPAPSLPLTVVDHVEIVSSPGGKPLDFESEFYTQRDQSTRLRGAETAEPVDAQAPSP